MSISSEPGDPFLRAYSLVRRSGGLRTSVGRRLFKSAYFLYKRYVEDDLETLLQAFPDLVGNGNALVIDANIGYMGTVLARAIKPNRKVREVGFDPSHLIDLLVESNFEVYLVYPQRKLSRGISPVSMNSSYFDLLFNQRRVASDRKTW